MTPNQFTDIYKRLPVEKLLDIIDNKKDYQSLAIETAIYELETRRLSEDDIAEASRKKLENINKKAQAYLLIQNRIDTAKKTADKAFTLLDPFIERTPQRTIKVICLVLGIISVIKFISNFYFVKFMFFEATKWELPDVFIIFELFFLPISIAFLWQLKKLGRILFSLWLIYNLVSALSLFVLLFSRPHSDSPLNFLLPQTDLSTFLFITLISISLLYYINKRDVKTLFK